MRNERIKSLIEDLKEILDVSEIIETDKLEDFDNWDSLAILSIIISFDDNFDQTLTRDQVTSCTSINDLLNLVNEG